MYGIEFYDEYLLHMGNLKNKPDLATPYKIEYLKTLIKDNKVYKFISFQEHSEIKLKTLMEEKIWFSFYKTLNDDTEFQINYKIKKVVSKTGCSKDYIKLITNYLTEMYDVFSLTYSYEDYMWREYAAGGNGVCVEYNVGDYDFLYPVEYCDKSAIDFTQMIIEAIKNEGMALSIIPWVVKNSYNSNAGIDSTREKEVRILYCPYDLADFNGGRVEYNIKERRGYKGIAKPLTEFGMTTSRIIIGNKCNQYMSSEIIRYADKKHIYYDFQKE